MNKEQNSRLYEDLNQLFNQITEDRIYFKIERDKKGKRFTIAVYVFRVGGVTPIPTSIFPKFDNVMDAYIYCVGLIHTAYQDTQAYFTSEDNVIWKELCRLQDDSCNDDYADNQAEKRIVAATRQHNNGGGGLNGNDL